MRLFCSLLAIALVIALPAAAGAAKPKPRPDYTAAVLAQTQSSVEVGEDFRVAVELRRANFVASAKPRLRVVFSADTKVSPDDVVVGTIAMLPAKPYRTSSTTFEFDLPADALGVHHLIACADFDRKVVESSERNNCATYAVTGVPSD